MYMQKVKIKGHSVQKLEWKTDRRTDGGNCITSRANAVGNNGCHTITWYTTGIGLQGYTLGRTSYAMLARYNMLSSCLSVCPSYAGVVSKWLNLRSAKTPHDSPGNLVFDVKYVGEILIGLPLTEVPNAIRVG